VRWVVWLVLALGCDTSIHEKIGPDAAFSAACVEAETHSDLAWISDNVFYNSCAKFTSCHHAGGGSAERLDLSAASAYAQLVNKPSVESPGWMRVVPGDPNHSYLLVKMGVVHGPLGDAGTTMPPQNTLVCAPKRAAVERWIASGAPSGIPDAGAVVDGNPSD
jgi:hypothetical protein